MNSNYKTYTKERDDFSTAFQFVEATALPKDLPISTPLTFAFVGTEVILVEKRDGQWDIPGGKMEPGEGWIDTLRRETYEEAGVYITHIQTVGYILAKNTGDLTNAIFPEVNVLPVTISFVTEVDENWVTRETVGRNIFKRNEAKELLAARTDGGQLLEIFEYVCGYFDQQSFEYTFDYYEKGDFADVPTTQAMVFCRNEEGKFCIVRDSDESFFSLPGGGCHLGESGLACAQREVKEEAQFDSANIQKVGTVVVSLLKNGRVISKTKHVRYFADIQNMGDFVPNKDGFEVGERAFVDFDELRDKVKLLKNASGEKVLDSLKKLI